MQWPANFDKHVDLSKVSVWFLVNIEDSLVLTCSTSTHRFKFSFKAQEMHTLSLNKPNPLIFIQVSLDVINDWIEKRITSLLGMEDEVVCNYAQSQLEECVNTADDNKNLCPKKM